ncbi:Crp/Fnr family transcriptional regulator [Listeria rustica]|uniref:Crp/Fnr family transcriptional regulator n=1 Tax=Listeria rustica TaxID=2713503 RepID=A0A7W1T4N0_9LIST|nr:Crp/Fnr family transcriptional regulator [Listeria rustica]MBA3925432.1 Crp/Fnr family transcriptional regulator [Listeria rustica]
MLYKELFDKDVIDEKFGNSQLLRLLQDNNDYPVTQKKIELKQKETLIYENTVHDYVYLIESGIFGAYKESHIVSFIGKNEFIGMDNILGNEASYLTVTALEKSVVWRFLKKDVMWKLMHMQEGLFFLYIDLKLINEHWIQRNAIQVADAKERIISNIIQLGNLYGEETENQIILPKVFTKKIISNYLNLTSTTVYFFCKQLIKEGVLEAISYQLIVNKNKIKKSLLE